MVCLGCVAAVCNLHFPNVFFLELIQGIRVLMTFFFRVLFFFENQFF